MEILHRLRMIDCRPMSTPLVTNWMKINASYSKTVDPIVYRLLIGSLMYLVNTRPYTIFAIKSLIQFTVDPQRIH
jgi:hypothetical protein